MVTGYAGDNDVIFGSEQFVITRFIGNGTLDNSFNNDGVVIGNFGGNSDTSRCIVVQNDGKIVIAGQSTMKSSTDFALARYPTNGTLDESFNSLGHYGSQPGIVITEFPGVSSINAIALQQDAENYSSRVSHLS